MNVGAFLTVKNRLTNRLSNESGSVVLSVMVAGMVSIGLSVAMINSTLSNKKIHFNDVNEDSARIAGEKIRALSGYLITNNLMLCRNEGWVDISGAPKCKWGGVYHQPTIDEGEFGLTKRRYEKGVLKYDLTVDVDGVSVASELSFDLVDWRTNKEVMSLVGEIPNLNSRVDDDSFLVIINVESPYFSPSSNTMKVARIVGALRRPQGMPMLLVTGNSSCQSTCVAGEDQNPHLECRGPHEIPEKSVSTTQVRVKNLGPGPLYNLQYHKTISFADIVGEKDQHAFVNIMQADQVFMPDRELLVPDTVVCMQPKKTVRTVTVRRRGSRRGRNRGGTTTTQTTVNSHQEQLAKVQYNISVSPYEPSEANKSGFWSGYNRNKTASFKKNTTLASIEPKRYGGPQQSKADYNIKRDVTDVTVTKIYYYPPH